MRLAVCFKQVPDTSARLKVEPGKRLPTYRGFLPVVNPYDEFALEEALKMKQTLDEAEICLFSMDRQSVEETIFHGLAMGADRAEVLALPDEAEESLRPIQSAQVLLERIRAFDPQVIFCGARAVDDDAAQVGSILAEAMGWPQICGIEGVRLDREEGEVVAKCRRESRFETIRSDLPCVLTFLRGAELPRYPSMKAVFSVQSKPVNQRSVKVQSLEDGSTRVRLYAQIKERRKEILEGDPEDALEALLDRIGQYTSVEI